MGGTKEDAEKKFQKARRKAKKAMQSVKEAIEDGGIAINHAHGGIRRWVDDMAGLKKLGMSILIVLVAEATVQKALLVLNRYAQRLASVVEGYTAHLEGLGPTDHIALLILGTLIVATFLLSLQLRTIGYSLRRTNLYMEDLQVHSQGEPSAGGQKTMTDGGDPESGKSDQENHQKTDADSDSKRGTSKVGDGRWNVRRDLRRGRSSGRHRDRGHVRTRGRKTNLESSSCARAENRSRRE